MPGLTDIGIFLIGATVGTFIAAMIFINISTPNKYLIEKGIGEYNQTTGDFKIKEQYAKE